MYKIYDKRYEGCFSAPRGRAYSAEGKPELSSTCSWKHRRVSISSSDRGAHVSRLGRGTDWGRHNTNTAARCRRRQQEQLMWKRWRCRWCRFRNHTYFLESDSKKTEKFKKSNSGFLCSQAMNIKEPKELQRMAREYCKDMAVELTLPAYHRWTLISTHSKISILLLSGLPQVSLDF